MKNSFLTCTDMFCGAGGSSIGAERSGVQVKMAMNHWKLAIETHSTNFQNTDHDCTDLSASDPRRYPSTDILIASPECTNHSLAKGKKIIQRQMELYDNGTMDPAAERSRATMWDVCRFAEYHKYNAIIVENVVDARKWVMFDAWLNAMTVLGYLHKCCYINSMHCHPTPQSRDRMYVVFWKKNNKKPNLEYMPVAHCPKCTKDVNSVQSWKIPQKPFGKYRQQYVYRCPSDGTVIEPYYYAAFNIIDWSDMGTRIGERKKLLADNSITRIRYGLDKYSNKPLIVVNYSPGYKKQVTDPTGTITTADHHGILTPFIVNNKFTSGIGNRVKRLTEKLDTVTGGIHSGILTDDSWQSFLTAYNNGSNCTKHISEETGSITTNDRISIVNYQKPNIEDCYYRMLKPPEIQAAMAFNQEYKVLGNGREKVKQLGNAVTPPAMEWLIERVVESLN